MPIPKYAFQVQVTRKLGDKQLRETKNFEIMDAAYSYSSIAMRKPGVARVQVLVVIDDSNPRIEDANEG